MMTLLVLSVIPSLIDSVSGERSFSNFLKFGLKII